MTVEFGAPAWTEGQFQRISALDDLGLESVGAGLLRRLLPGIVQTTPNAGYYAFYPYLLTKWEELSDSLLRVDFKPFYRRQEAAYAVACGLHHHRGALAGVQGSNGAGEAIRSSGAAIDVGRLAETYMDSAYGGYGLFYARVLEDMRLTRLGAGKFVDRVSDRGREVAAAFGEAFEATQYFSGYFQSDEVPRAVLEELGEATCLCEIPGRVDHMPLLDCFFGEPIDDPLWESRRRTRVESLSLFLEFHRQRPESVAGDLASFRQTIAEGVFPEGSRLETPFVERLNSWRAYQLRECETLVLTTIWSRYLDRLEQLEPITHVGLREDLVLSTDWTASELEPKDALSEALAKARAALSAGGLIVEAAAAQARGDWDEVGAPLASCLRVLLAIRAEAESDSSGFAELRDEGGSGRWSLEHLSRWMDARSDSAVDRVLGELLDELYYQHVRVALGKVSPTDSRDPFCVGDDDGVLRLIRSDEPFWTSGRFEVVNHLLWTLGIFDDPTGDSRLTSLGEAVRTKSYVDA